MPSTFNLQPDTYIGVGIRRVEDERLVRGAGRFVDDLALPGLAHAAFLRSPYPHARITRLETNAALHAPGVLAVLTANDLRLQSGIPVAPMPGLQPPPHPCLATDRVRIVGEPVAAVAAESRGQAEDALRLIEVDYEPLPAVGTIEAALEPDAPLLHDACPGNVALRRVQRGGDPETAFAGATRSLRLRLEHPRLASICMEPRGLVASHDGFTGDLTVWTSTQAPFGVRTDLAALLGVAENRIRVIAPDVGGGFGAKGAVHREEAVVAVLAMRLNRPIKWVATRIEDLQTTVHGRGDVNEVEAAFEPDGRVVALRVRTLLDLGAYLYRHSAVPSMRLLFYSTGTYQISHLESEVVGVLTNAAPTGPYRGAGRPEAAFLVERVMDEVARELSLDPLEVRRRNFIPPSAFPYRAASGVVYDSGEYEKALERALELADYPRLREEQRRRREQEELVGLGWATFTEVAGGGWESGTVRVERTGKVTAITGSSSHGQGHATSFAQVLADALQVPMLDVAIRYGDTGVGPPGTGTFGSRSTPLGASALAVASAEVLAKARTIAAHVLEVAPEDLDYREGRFIPAGVPDRSMSLSEVATRAYGGVGLPPGVSPGLEATSFFQAASDNMPFGAYLAMVSVDRETGRVAVERLVAVDDCGNVINPLLVEGQLQGGIAQGIGEALLEEVVYDAEGQLLTSSLLDYAVPVAEGMPPLVVDRTVTPTSLNPLGAKGVGEAGTVGSPAAIANAVLDALAPLGVREISLPFTPLKVWGIIQRAEAASRD